MKGVNGYLGSGQMSGKGRVITDRSAFLLVYRKSFVVVVVNLVLKCAAEERRNLGLWCHGRINELVDNVGHILHLVGANRPSDVPERFLRESRMP